MTRASLSIASSRADSVNYGTTPSSRAVLTPHSLAGVNFHSKAPAQVHREKLFLLGQPRSTGSPNISSILSSRNLSNLGSSDEGATQFVTQYCGSTDLLDGSIKARARNGLQAFLEPVFA